MFYNRKFIIKPEKTTIWGQVFVLDHPPSPQKKKSNNTTDKTIKQRNNTFLVISCVNKELKKDFVLHYFF